MSLVCVPVSVVSKLYADCTPLSAVAPTAYSLPIASLGWLFGSELGPRLFVFPTHPQPGARSRSTRRTRSARLRPSLTVTVQGEWAIPGDDSRQ